MKPNLDAVENDLAQAEQHIEKKPADLDHPKFLEFLAEYPDAESIDLKPGSEELDHRYNAFVQKEAVVKDLNELYKARFQLEANLDITDTDLKEIDTYVSKQIIDNPESIIEFRNQLDAFHQAPSKIESAKSKLFEAAGITAASGEDAFAVIRDRLQAEQSSLEKIKDRFNWFVRRIAVNEIGEGGPRKVTKQQVEERLEDIQDQLVQLDITEQKLLSLESNLDSARSELLEYFEPLEGLQKIVQAKIQKKFGSFMKDLDAKNIKELDEYKAEYERLKEVQAAGTKYVLGDYFDDTFEQQLDEAIENKMKMQIEKAVDAVAAKSEGRVKKLSITLKPFFDREAIGSVEGNEVQKWLQETLKEIRDKQTDKVKRLLINAYLAQVE